MKQNRRKSYPVLTTLSLLIATLFLAYCTTPEQEQNTSNKQETAKRALEDVPELAVAMSELHRYTHKFALAVDAKNKELADFYFHEVRASADGIKANIPGYEGYDIARFMRMFFDPTVEPVQEALGTKDWEEIRARTIDMVNSCNSCHNATAHGFVKITPGFDKNPYNQDFSAPK